MAEAAVTEAPSAGAQPATAATTESGASPTTGSEQLTDEQILGIGGAEQTPSGEAQAATPGAKEPGAGEETTQSQQDDESAQQQQTGITPEVRDFFKAHPEIRDAYYRAAEFKRLFPDFKTAETVSRYLERYESPQELIESLQGVSEVNAIDRMYYSADPADQGRIVENLFTNSPDEARRLIGAIPDSLVAMMKSDNEALAKQAKEAWLDENTRTLTLSLNHSYQEALAKGEDGQADAETLERAAELMLGRAPWSPEATAERLAKLEQRQQEQRARQEQQRNEGLLRWTAEASKQTTVQVRSAIRETVDRLAPSFSDDAKSLLVGEINRRIETILVDPAKSADLIESVQVLSRGGQGNERVQAQLVRLVSNAAKRLIPGIAEKLITAFGSGTLATTQELEAKRAAAASRVDVTGSAGMDAKPVRVPTVDDFKKSGGYGKYSNDDILEGRIG